MRSAGYAANELRRRRSRTVLTALGLASGVGLVMGIVGVSAGLDQAQAKVLSPLSSVGTDILVTRTVGATTTASATPTPTPTPTQGGATTPRGQGFFRGPGGGQSDGLSSLNEEDQAALLEENSSVVTDLSKLGKAGTKFTRDFFLPGTLLTFPDDAIDQIEGVDGVTSAVGGLTVQAQHQTGTVPEIVARVKTGGETLKTTVRPSPMTESEMAAFRSCIEKNGGFGGPTTETAAPRPSASPGGDGGQRVFIGGFGKAQECLPARFQEYEANVVTPQRIIDQIVNPPETDTSNESYTAAGVDPASKTSGLITTAQLTAGTWFSANPKNEVVVSAAYASKKSLHAGSTLTINGTTYTVVGIANPTLTGNTADVYFALSTLQSLASKSGRVNEVLVKARSADEVDAVAARIRELLPGAQVVTTKSLADQVTGSLHDAKQVAGRLGGALAIIVLGAAFVIAVLLTLSSVAKRVREIGTLRAIGWSRGRIVRQLVTETAGIGLLGGAIGIGVGYVVAAAVHAFSPTLNATTSGVTVASSAASFFGEHTEAVTRTVTLSAPISATTLLLGMLCALAGGLVAGAVGGWRASRLAPAVALRDLG